MSFIKWDYWYAWRPVYINNEDVRGFVWLETVRRRRVFDRRKARWEYELIG